MRHDDWSSADLHMHTTASDGTATPEMVVEWACAETDLAVIAVTDHNTNEGGLRAAAYAEAGGYPIEVIVGQEVESSDGHVVGLWTPERVSPGMSAADTVAAIHAQGGLAVCAHPFAPRIWAKAGLDRGSRRVYDETGYDAFEVANSTPMLLFANWVARAYWYRHRDRMACTGGSDAHALHIIGTSRTLFHGVTADDLRRAIEARTTRALRPGLSPMRNLRYARSVREIIARDRERRAREIEHGIRSASESRDRP